MTKHKPQYNLKSLEELQNMWSVCSQLGYAIQPSLANIDIIHPDAYFTTQPPFVLSAVTDTITSAFQLISQLFEELEANRLEWNYLGNTESRTNILAYFESVFWSNHNAIHSHPDYIDILSHPWRISSFIDYLDQIVTPIEMMDNHSIATLQKLSSVFEGFELNPFLIINPLGSVHFVIHLEHNIIRGYVSKQEEGFHMHSTIERTHTQLELEHSHKKAAEEK